MSTQDRQRIWCACRDRLTWHRRHPLFFDTWLCLVCGHFYHDGEAYCE